MTEPTLSPEEYRKRLLAEKRRTMRTVRNTLLAVAVLAALWWLVLLAKDRASRTEPIVPPAASPAASEPVSTETKDADRDTNPAESTTP